MQAMKAFKEKIEPIAKKIEAELGISAKIGMAQAAHESAYGTSGLTQKANNLFGFTGNSWKAQGKPTVDMPTTEWKDGKPYKTTRPFRAYGSWEESYRDWARLMQTDHYTKVGSLDALKAGDMTAFANAMNRAGYATDPNYGTKLIRVSGDMVA